MGRAHTRADTRRQPCCLPMGLRCLPPATACPSTPTSGFPPPITALPYEAYACAHSARPAVQHGQQPRPSPCDAAARAPRRPGCSCGCRRSCWPSSAPTPAGAAGGVQQAVQPHSGQALTCWSDRRARLPIAMAGWVILTAAACRREPSSSWMEPAPGQHLAPQASMFESESPTLPACRRCSRSRSSSSGGGSSGGSSSSSRHTGTLPRLTLPSLPPHTPCSPPSPLPFLPQRTCW